MSHSNTTRHEDAAVEAVQSMASKIVARIEADERSRYLRLKEQAERWRDRHHRARR